MGRTTTPTYRIQVQENINPGIWKDHGFWDKRSTERFGKPSNRGLELWMDGVNESFGPSGVNSHVGMVDGIQRQIIQAKVTNQITGEIKAQVN